MHSQVTYQRTHFRKEPHPREPDIVEVDMERKFPADEHWDAVIMGQEVKRDEVSPEIIVRILLRFVNNTREAVEAHDPARILAFRGPVEIDIRGNPRPFIPVLVGLTYRMPWSGSMPGLLMEIGIDAVAVHHWLKSKPVPKSEEAVETPA